MVDLQSKIIGAELPEEAAVALLKSDAIQSGIDRVTVDVVLTEAQQGHVEALHALLDREYLDDPDPRDVGAIEVAKAALRIFENGSRAA